MKSELDIDRVTEAIIDGTKKSDIKVKLLGTSQFAFNTGFNWVSVF